MPRKATPILIRTILLKPTGATGPRYREPLKLLLIHGRGNANSGA